MEGLAGSMDNDWLSMWMMRQVLWRDFAQTEARGEKSNGILVESTRIFVGLWDYFRVMVWGRECVRDICDDQVMNIGFEWAGVGIFGQNGCIC